MTLEENRDRLRLLVREKQREAMDQEAYEGDERVRSQRWSLVETYKDMLKEVENKLNKKLDNCPQT